MLVTLATNQAIASGASSTATYSPSSVQKVFIKVEDPTGNNAQEATVTVQIGSRTIVNGVRMFTLGAFSTLSTGGAQGANSQTFASLDFGSWQCLNNDNLYVTVSAPTALDAVDISAIVDEPMAGSEQIMYNVYTDQTFTASNVLTAIITGQSESTVIDENTNNVTMTTATHSSSPNLVSACNWYENGSFGNGTFYLTHVGILAQNDIPMDTTFNYSVADLDILCAQVVPSTSASVVKASESANNAVIANQKKVVSQV